MTRTPGTYALLLSLDREVQIAVGRLGIFPFPPGWLLYIGSALGGLDQRLRRYRVGPRRRYWHVDFLLQRARLRQIWSMPSSDRLECAWAGAARRLPGARIVVAGFGSSDCRCPSHLVHSTIMPDPEAFAHLLGLPSARSLRVEDIPSQELPLRQGSGYNSHAQTAAD